MSTPQFPGQPFIINQFNQFNAFENQFSDRLPSPKQSEQSRQNQMMNFQSVPELLKDKARMKVQVLSPDKGKMFPLKSKEQPITQEEGMMSRNNVFWGIISTEENKKLQKQKKKKKKESGQLSTRSSHNDPQLISKFWKSKQQDTSKTRQFSPSQDFAIVKHKNQQYGSGMVCSPSQIHIPIPSHKKYLVSPGSPSSQMAMLSNHQNQNGKKKKLKVEEKLLFQGQQCQQKKEQMRENYYKEITGNATKKKSARTKKTLVDPKQHKFVNSIISQESKCLSPVINKENKEDVMKKSIVTPKSKAVLCKKSINSQSDSKSGTPSLYESLFQKLSRMNNVSNGGQSQPTHKKQLTNIQEDLLLDCSPLRGMNSPMKSKDHSTNQTRHSDVHQSSRKQQEFFTFSPQPISNSEDFQSPFLLTRVNQSQYSINTSPVKQTAQEIYQQILSYSNDQEEDKDQSVKYSEQVCRTILDMDLMHKRSMTDLKDNECQKIVDGYSPKKYESHPTLFMQPSSSNSIQTEALRQRYSQPFQQISDLEISHSSMSSKQLPLNISVFNQDKKQVDTSKGGIPNQDHFQFELQNTSHTGSNKQKFFEYFNKSHPQNDGNPDEYLIQKNPSESIDKSQIKEISKSHNLAVSVLQQEESQSTLADLLNICIPESLLQTLSTLDYANSKQNIKEEEDDAPQPQRLQFLMHQNILSGRNTTRPFTIIEMSEPTDSSQNQNSHHMASITTLKQFSQEPVDDIKIEEVIQENAQMERVQESFKGSLKNSASSQGHEGSNDQRQMIDTDIKILNASIITSDKNVEDLNQEDTFGAQKYVLVKKDQIRGKNKKVTINLDKNVFEEFYRPSSESSNGDSEELQSNSISVYQRKKPRKEGKKEEEDNGKEIEEEKDEATASFHQNHNFSLTDNFVFEYQRQKDEKQQYDQYMNKKMVNQGRESMESEEREEKEEQDEKDQDQDQSSEEEDNNKNKQFLPLSMRIENFTSKYFSRGEKEKAQDNENLQTMSCLEFTQNLLKEYSSKTKKEKGWACQ